MLQVTPLPPPPPLIDPGAIAPMIAVIAVLIAATIVLLPIARAFARRLEGKSGDVAGLRAELDETRARLGELEERQAHVAELEERLDFAERLLAQQERARLGGVPPQG